MGFMQNLTIKSKLFIMAAFMAAMLLITGGMAFWGAKQAKNAMEKVYSDHVTAINTLNEVRNFQLQMQIELIGARLEQDPFGKR